MKLNGNIERNKAHLVKPLNHTFVGCVSGCFQNAIVEFAVQKLSASHESTAKTDANEKMDVGD
jgi:hypothetical protein